ncbi:zf-CCHC domain-containing protein [Tanacetum coccineum]
MESEKYLEGQSMQRPPLFESDGFIYWKNRFETYVKSKDLDLWHVITYGDFPPIQNNPETKKDEVVPFHKQNDDLKKKIAKNNEAKMKDSEMVKGKREQNRSLALKAKKESSDEDSSTCDSEDEEYTMANDKSERKCFKCGDPNHLIRECPKLSRNYNQRAFVGGSWSDIDEEGEEKTKDEKCLMAKASDEIEDYTFSNSMTGLPKDFSFKAISLEDVEENTIQILRNPYNGPRSLIKNGNPASLAFFQETEGPYNTDLPTPDDIRQFLQLERVKSNRTIKSKNVILTPNQILTKELRHDMKR